MNIKAYLKRNAMTLILLIGMIIILLCIPSQIKENMITQSAISPRFFPTVATVGIIVSCILILLFDLKDTVFGSKKNKSAAAAAEAVEEKEELTYFRVFLVVLLLLAWYFLMPRIGFIISTVAVMCIMSFLLGCRNKIVLVVFPVVFTVVLYFAFVRLLHVSLPEILF